MCISSLAQVHGILTVSCRHGCLMKRFHGEKKEPTRIRCDKCGTVTVSARSSDMQEEKLINAHFTSPFAAEQS